MYVVSFLFKYERKETKTLNYGQSGGSHNYSIPLVKLRQKVFRLDHPDVIWFISDTIAKGRNIEIKGGKDGYLKILDVDKHIA